ncbi:MAG: tRNA (N(6)-L-threonylcarbamoyladenosine(37)-C(2))-methylthiotransferase MtaB [Oscillospiraceae bacterium]|nr:tRNA (N(6)-L-threonylcarbamoyladenosine(37)-C(2))-methylthiotransferase MtaB [Oscillospiraceae bacterium]
MKFAIYTLGCKVNQYETQAMETELQSRGHTLVPFEELADTYIINTCAVTATSGHKSRQIIRRAQKQNPDALVAVCGCYPQTDPAAVAALGVDLVGGSDRRMEFLNELEKLWESRQGDVIRLKANDCPGSPRTAQDKQETKITVGNIMSTRTYEPLPAGGLSTRTRAMLKVEDGCVNFCSYCIIPYARGPVRSLPMADAAKEAGRLMAEGYKEIVLTGIEISSWGQDLRNGFTLTDLVEAICAAAPDCRIRLGSLEPRTVTEDFCKRLSVLPNLCPHFHLSMQSGCDETLKRMNRKYDTARYYESVTLLRQWFENPGITTDLIVGFPGETMEEFTAPLAFIEKCAFSAMHIFPYSRRPGTPADKMPDQVPKGEKESRARRASEVAGRLEKAYLESLVGQVLPILFEEEKSGLWRGHAPNYVEVWCQSGKNLHNVERQVTVTGLNGDKVMRELQPNKR